MVTTVQHDPSFTCTLTQAADLATL